MDEIIAWLMTLIGFPTASDGDGAGACVSFIEKELVRRGVSVTTFVTEDGPRAGRHLLAEVRGERRDGVMLHAHLDTAGYGRREDWAFPADRALRRDGRVWGRGALDCKGPLAVWMKLLTDAAELGPQPYTLKLLVTDLEEEGGEHGLGLLLTQRPELLEDVRLVIGEGGGFPFPFREDIFYTFQTGEREFGEDRTAEEPGWEEISRVLSMGVERGYYSGDILAYAARAPFLTGRRLDVRPLYAGMEEFFRDAGASTVFGKYGQLFETALRQAVPSARLMPCITPGTSDNRWFRSAGVPVVGFFPLDVRNPLGGIHGPDECISEASLCLAYRTMSRILERIVPGD